jgi:hypothetical protein
VHIKGRRRERRESRGVVRDIIIGETNILLLRRCPGSARSSWFRRTKTFGHEDSRWMRSGTEERYRGGIFCLAVRIFHITFGFFIRVKF